MDSGWVAAIASLVSAMVVIVTAVAAFLQIKHFRNANDITVYLRLVDQMNAAMTLQTRASLAKVAADLAADPEYHEKFRDPRFVPEDFQNMGTMLRDLEHISVLVTRGGVAQRMILAEYADTFAEIWEQTYPVIVERRTVFGPHTGRAFEHLAMQARRYVDSGRMSREYARLESDPRAHPGGQAKRRRP